MLADLHRRLNTPRVRRAHDHMEVGAFPDNSQRSKSHTHTLTHSHTHTLTHSHTHTHSLTHTHTHADTHFGSARADAKEDTGPDKTKTDCSSRAVSLEAKCGNNSFLLG